MFKMWRVHASILVIAVFAGIIMQYVSLFSTPGSKDRDSLSGFQKASHSLFPGEGSMRPAGQGPGMTERGREFKLSKDIISRFHTMYAPTINNPASQIQVIEEMGKTLKAEFPVTWQDRMYDALKAIFPENAEHLMDMFKKLIRYNGWLDKNWGKLIGMSRTERNNILLGKRKEIFGNEAKAIWTGEEKTEAIFNVLDGLNRVKGASLEEKLAFFVGTIRQEYGQEADVFIKGHQQELLYSFFSLESVQVDLARMQPLERRQSLRVIRQVMEMDEQTLARWEALEKVRDERWDKGLEYMKERQRIVDTTQGEDRERILGELRLKYFGNDAVTVASEEKAGYFRFKVRRVYGLN
jgi:hypothetical protein